MARARAVMSLQREPAAGGRRRELPGCFSLASSHVNYLLQSLVETVAWALPAV